MNGAKPKLTPEQRRFVCDIAAKRRALRAALASLPTNAELSQQLGVSATTIRAIYDGREYKHDREVRTVPRETSPNNLGAQP